jgi:hypothetical protein
VALPLLLPMVRVTVIGTYQSYSLSNEPAKFPEGLLPPQRITTSRARRPMGALPIEIGVP